MTRVFNGSTSHLGPRTVLLSSGLRDEPLTICTTASLWQGGAGAAYGHIVTLQNPISAFDWFAVYGRQSGGTNIYAFGAETRTSFVSAGRAEDQISATPTFSHYRIVARFVANNDRRINVRARLGATEYNGSATDSTDISISGCSELRMGTSTGSGRFWDGAIGETALYSSALSDDETEEWLNGAPAYMISPSTLEYYYPMWGENTVAVELLGGNTLAVNGSCPRGASDPYQTFPGWRPGDVVVWPGPTTTEVVQSVVGMTSSALANRTRMSVGQATIPWALGTEDNSLGDVRLPDPVLVIAQVGRFEVVNLTENAVQGVVPLSAAALANSLTQREVPDAAATTMGVLENRLVYGPSGARVFDYRRKREQ